MEGPLTFVAPGARIEGDVTMYVDSSVWFGAVIRGVDAPVVIEAQANVQDNAVVEDIVERHRVGQPVLVGTTSVEKSEYLSQQLRKRGVSDP